MVIEKRKIVRDEKHRRFIASLPCCVSGRVGETQAAHIRAGTLSLGMKPSDTEIVPLSVEAHNFQHKVGEQKFWLQYGGISRAKELSRQLYAFSGDREQALRLLAEFPA